VKKTLNIFSYGLKFSHITLETIEAFKTCGVVYCPVFDKVMAAKFSAKFRELGPKLELFSWTGQAHMDKLVLAGFAAQSTVGMLTFGNPAFLNQPFHKLAETAAARGIQTVFFNAVSSIDALITLFRLNLENELRLVETTRFTKKTVLTPGVNTMFFSIHDGSPAGRRSKQVFLSRLSAAYRADAAVYLAACGAGENGEDSLLKSTVGELALLLGRATEKHTLFIPADSWRREGRNNFYGAVDAGKNIMAR